MSRTVGISEDEWYPCYQIVEPKPWHETVTIDDDRAAWVERVMAEFNEVQDYLETLYRGLR